MKKYLLYSMTAVILGIVITLAPLIALAEIRRPISYENAMSLGLLPKQLEELENPRPNAPNPSGVDLEIFTISFVIALVGYVLFKRRTPRHDYRVVGTFPY